MNDPSAPYVAFWQFLTIITVVSLVLRFIERRFPRKKADPPPEVDRTIRVVKGGRDDDRPVA